MILDPSKPFDRIRDAASYNDYAEAYATSMARLGRPIAEYAARLAGVRYGSSVLDVGTGSGIAARSAAELVGENGLVVGVDLSNGMLQASRRLSNQDGKSPVYSRMDAQELACRHEAFDAVISLCSVAHFPDLDAFFIGSMRVLKRNGKIVASFGYPRPIRTLPLLAHASKEIYREALRPVKPLLKAPLLFRELADRYLPSIAREDTSTSWSQGSPRSGLMAAMRQAGFVDLRSSWAGKEFLFESAPDFWDAQAAIVTDVRKRMLLAEPEAVAAMKAEFLLRAEEVLQRKGLLVYRWGAYFVSGSKRG